MPVPCKHARLSASDGDSATSSAPDLLVCDRCQKECTRKKKFRDKNSKSGQDAKWEVLPDLEGFYSFVDTQVLGERESAISLTFKEKEFRIDVRDDGVPLKRLATCIRDEINHQTDYRWTLVQFLRLN